MAIGDGFMVRVVFTPVLRRHVDCPEVCVEAGSVGEALEQVFGAYPQVRSYVLDEQGRLRTHVVVFVDGESISDRNGLSDVVCDGAEIYVMQALSGG